MENFAPNFSVGSASTFFSAIFIF